MGILGILRFSTDPHSSVSNALIRSIKAAYTVIFCSLDLSCQQCPDLQRSHTGSRGCFWQVLEPVQQDMGQNLTSNRVQCDTPVVHTVGLDTLALVQGYEDRVLKVLWDHPMLSACCKNRLTSQTHYVTAILENSYRNSILARRFP